MSEAVVNTDREIWREVEGDYYAPSIHVTEHGGIGIDVGGHVIVKSVRQWHELASQWQPITPENLPNEECEVYSTKNECVTGPAFMGKSFEWWTVERDWTHFRPINPPAVK